MDYYLIGELSINGALVGLMYSLVALGIVLIYKASRYANLAQGAFAMTGGYLCVVLAQMLGLPMWLAVPLSAGMLFLLGMLVERLMLRRMIGQPIIMVIMLTLGLEILLRGLIPGSMGSAVRKLDLGIPQQPLFIGEMLINRAYLVGGLVALALIAAAILFFNSRVGVRMRAVSDDQIASWSVGIRVERVIAVAWGLAGLAAAAAGILWGSVQGVDWTLSLLLLKGLAIAILGGLDSIGGVLIAGLIIGIAESLAAGYLDTLVGGGTRDVVASVIILLTVLVRPHGLFGREHIERV
ncbi:MAG TPA: branched-chain amino acid ABC transporter permease [Burkholderiaceae bacterium]|jgi:branched-chain amino acid transport system permease protein|nr:branched-chain amino acid ABC transporter permease [Burkholderiaceae bacterium]